MAVGAAQGGSANVGIGDAGIQDPSQIEDFNPATPAANPQEVSAWQKEDDDKVVAGTYDRWKEIGSALGDGNYARAWFEIGYGASGEAKTALDARIEKENKPPSLTPAEERKARDAEDQLIRETKDAISTRLSKAFQALGMPLRQQP